MTPPAPPPLPHPFQRLPQRLDRAEILDEQVGVSPDQLARSLAAMTTVNHWLGGTGPLLGHLRRLVRSHGLRTLSLLDVGVGNAQVPRTLQERLAREGVELSWVGVDRSRPVLRIAQQESGRATDLVQADGLTLPFPTESFDVVTSSLTLHHLSGAQAEALLAEAARVARRAVVMSDLERHPANYLGARILGLTLWRRDPITRYDGPVSVLRSFSRDELLTRARTAPFRQVSVHRHPPFRLVLVGRTD